jgi:hypothetical protein
MTNGQSGAQPSIEAPGRVVRRSVAHSGAVTTDLSAGIFITDQEKERDYSQRRFTHAASTGSSEDSYHTWTRSFLP